MINCLGLASFLPVSIKVWSLHSFELSFTLEAKMHQRRLANQGTCSKQLDKRSVYVHLLRMGHFYSEA